MMISMLSDSFKRLFSLSSEPQPDEVADLGDLAKELHASKYTNTNSNTDAISRLLAATRLEDPTQAAPILDPVVKWEVKEPGTRIRVPDQVDKSLDSNFKDEPSQNEDKPSTSKTYDESKPNIGVDAVSLDCYSRSDQVDLINKQIDLMDLLQSEYDSVLPAPPLFEKRKFAKEGRSDFKMLPYHLPKSILLYLQRNTLKLLYLNDSFNEQNYVQKFQKLLWLEEAHQLISMRKYDMQNVLLAKYENSSYLLNVPGLAEGRPSLMRGDNAILKSLHRNSYYEAHIAEVRQNDVILVAHRNIDEAVRAGHSFDVHFVSSRTSFKRCHHGICMYRKNENLQQVVFPKQTQITQKPYVVVRENPQEFRCFMTDLNIFQRNAVIKLLENKCRPAPYIIFGPPGTGKTVTMVEAILQVYARMPKSKILVCANSNASTDLLAKRIYERRILKKDQLIRLSAFYRFDQDIIPEDVKDVTKDMEMISNREYEECRILVTTCVQAGALYEFDTRFDFVFIDEAGHANEPESMIALGLMKSSGACALAGDPHQLGPVCVSNVAKQHGLGLSLLERIFTRNCYIEKLDEKTIFNEDFITKLKLSYRCDRRIMVVNNKQFYQNELEFFIKTPQKWLDVMKSDRPIIYHPVYGRDRREYMNPSWFNANEAIKCLIHVNNLYKAGLRPDQLGIIAPYRRQIDKLKTLFISLGLQTCKIATMEEFQGDEREVIIITTVRSREKNMTFDKDFNLGFLLDPKRFNVGISRAKWLIIVIGHPEILKRNPLWNMFLEEAYHIPEVIKS